MVMSKSKAIIAVFFIVSILLFTGCSEENISEPDKQTPPEIPPETSFIIHFEDFAQGNQMSFNGDWPSLSKPLSRINYAYAALTVSVWHTLTTVTLAVPTRAFLGVLVMDRKPELQEDGSWLWAHDFNTLGGLYHAELYGKIVAAKIQWEMYISLDGKFEDFMWFTGESELTAQEGTWRLFKSPQQAVPILDIEWTRDSDQQTFSTKYMNIEEGSDAYGSSIFYGVISDTTYDAFYEIFNKKKDKKTFIKWNRTSKAGRVKDDKFFKDLEWHCWDETFIDVECSD